MTRKRFEEMQRFYDGMQRLGFTTEEADKIRRIEMTLHRWAERECNGDVLWNDSRYINPNGYPVRDLETGALKRLEAIMASHPELTYYHQTDPRGCALYVIRKSDMLPDVPLDSQYSRGFAVCY